MTKCLLVVEPLTVEHDIAPILTSYANELAAGGHPAAQLREWATSLRSGEMPALVAVREGIPIGLIGWNIREGRGHITLLAVVEDDPVPAAIALLGEARQAMLTGGAHHIVHILRNRDVAAYDQAFRAAGFRAVQVDKMVRERLDDVETTPTPAGYRILPWRSQFTGRVVLLFRSIPRDPVESVIWPEYDTVAGVYDLVDFLTQPAPVKPPQTSYVAVDEAGNLVGYVLVRIVRDGSAHIGEIGVHPEHQRRGLGKALLTSALRAAAEHGLTPAWLTVLASNAPAIHLYRSLGFVTRASQHIYVWMGAPSVSAGS